MNKKLLLAAIVILLAAVLGHAFFKESYLPFNGFHIHLNLPLAAVILIGVFDSFWISISGAVLLSTAVFLLSGTHSLLSYLILLAGFLLVAVFSVFLYEFSKNLKNNVLFMLFFNLILITSANFAGEIILFYSGLSFHKHFLDFSSFLSIGANSIVLLLLGHPLAVFVRKEKGDLPFNLERLRWGVLFITPFIIATVFLAQYSATKNAYMSGYEKSLKNLEESVLSELSNFDNDLGDKISFLSNQTKFIASLPGLQWKMKAMIPARFKEFLNLYRSEGAESICLVSNSGNIVFSLGRKLSQEEILQAKKYLKEFPTSYSGISSVRGRIYSGSGVLGKYIYFVFPVYQLDPEPNKGTPPDRKLKGILLTKFDAEVIIRKIQIEDFDGKTFLFAIIQTTPSPTIISFGADILLDLKARKEMYKFLHDYAVFIEKKGSFKSQTEIAKSPFFVAAHIKGISGFKLITGAGESISSINEQLKASERDLASNSIILAVLLLGVLLSVGAVTVNINQALNNLVKEKEKEIISVLSKRFELVEKVLRDLPFGIILVDENGKVVLANDFAQILLEANFGKTDDINGTELEQVVFSSSKDKIHREEVLIGTRVLGTTVASLKIEGKEYRIIALSDITEVRSAQQAAVLESRSILLGKLAESYSHQINNPLQIALFNIELLLMKEGFDEDQRKLLEGTKEALERIAKFTRSILELKSPRTGVEKSIFNLNDLVSKIVRLVLPSANANGIDIELELSKEELIVECSQSRIEEAVLAIVTNAMNVLSSYQGERRIIVKTERRDSNAKIIIQDTGPGIPDEIIDQIFDPFFTTETKAPGMGLFLARQMVELEGGQISVFSEEGKGAIFTISIPLYRV